MQGYSIGLGCCPKAILGVSLGNSRCFGQPPRIGVSMLHLGSFGCFCVFLVPFGFPGGSLLAPQAPQGRPLISGFLASLPLGGPSGASGGTFPNDSEKTVFYLFLFHP